MKILIKTPEILRYSQVSSIIGCKKASKKDVLDFLGVHSKEQAIHQAEVYCNRYLSEFTKGKSEDNDKIRYSSVNPLNLFVIAQRIKADTLQDGNIMISPFSSEKLWQWMIEKSWYIDKGDIDYFKMLPQLFATYGIKMFQLPFIPNTVFGGVEWVKGHPVIIVTDRLKDLATAWFTFLKCVYQILNNPGEPIWYGSIGEFPKEDENEFLSDEFASDMMFHYQGIKLRKWILEWREKCRKENQILSLENFNLSALLKKTGYIFPKNLILFWIRKTLGLVTGFTTTTPIEFNPQLELSSVLQSKTQLDVSDEKFMEMVYRRLKVLKMSHAALADKIGVSRSFVCYLFKGRKPLSRERKFQIAQACQIELFTDSSFKNDCFTTAFEYEDLSNKERAVWEGIYKRMCRRASI